MLASLEAGDFYASTGVELDEYTADRTTITVRVRPAGDTRYRIRLVSGGVAVESVDGPTARFTLAGRTATPGGVADSNGAHAWAAVFLD